MEIKDFLQSIGWDPKKWTILKEGQWEPLTKVKGYQTYVYDAIKSPLAIKSFGKNSRVVERSFMNKHLASATADLPPAPPQQVSQVPKVPEVPQTPEIPKVPEVPKVPEDIQKVADESPNVVVASIAPEIPKAEIPEPVQEVPQEKDVMSIRGEIIESLDFKKASGAGFWFKDGKVVRELDIEDLSDEEFNKYLESLVPEETPKEEVKQEETKVETEEVPQPEVIEEEAQEDPDAISEDGIERAKELIEKLGFKASGELNKDAVLTAPNGEEISLFDLDFYDDFEYATYFNSFMASAAKKEEIKEEVDVPEIVQEEVPKEEKEEATLASAEKIEAIRKEQEEQRGNLEEKASEEVEAKKDVSKVEKKETVSTESKASDSYRDKLALKFILKMLPTTDKTPAKLTAYAYDLADRVINEKNA